jgi:hypothetical protein
MSNINKFTFFATGLTAGTFIDDQNKSIVYANLNVLEDKQNQSTEKDNISIGQEIGKMQVLTDNDNHIANQMVISKLIPGNITCTVKPVTKKGMMVLTIVGFDSPKAA